MHVVLMHIFQYEILSDYGNLVTAINNTFVIKKNLIKITLKQDFSSTLPDVGI